MSAYQLCEISTSIISYDILKAILHIYAGRMFIITSFPYKIVFVMRW